MWDELREAVHCYAIESCHVVIGALRSAGVDPSKRAVFEQVVEFLSLLDEQPQEEALATMIPVILERPAGDEWFAHYLNFGHTVAECKTLLSLPPKTGWIPEPLLSTFDHGSTPVTDRSLVFSMMWDEVSLNGYEQSTITLIAHGVKSGILLSDLMVVICDDLMNDRTATEYVSLLYSVSDIIQRTKDDMSFIIRFNNAFSALFELDPNATLEEEYVSEFDAVEEDGTPPLTMDTAEEFARQAALYRFMLAAKNAGKIIPALDHNWVGSVPPPDEAWVELIRSRNSVEDVEALARYYDERGGDAASAEKYLDERPTVSLGTGWL